MSKLKYLVQRLPRIYRWSVPWRGQALQAQSQGQYPGTLVILAVWIVPDLRATRPNCGRLEFRNYGSGLLGYEVDVLAGMLLSTNLTNATGLIEMQAQILKQVSDSTKLLDHQLVALDAVQDGRYEEAQHILNQIRDDQAKKERAELVRWISNLTKALDGLKGPMLTRPIAIPAGAMLEITHRNDEPWHPGERDEPPLQLILSCLEARNLGGGT